MDPVSIRSPRYPSSRVSSLAHHHHGRSVGWTRHPPSMDRVVYCRRRRGREGGVGKGSASNSTGGAGVVCHIFVQNQILDLYVCMGNGPTRIFISLRVFPVLKLFLIPSHCVKYIIRFTVKGISVNILLNRCNVNGSPLADNTE